MAEGVGTLSVEDLRLLHLAASTTVQLYDAVEQQGEDCPQWGAVQR